MESYLECELDIRVLIVSKFHHNSTNWNQIFAGRCPWIHWLHCWYYFVEHYMACGSLMCPHLASSHVMSKHAAYRMFQLFFSFLFHCHFFFFVSLVCGCSSMAFLFLYIALFKELGWQVAILGKSRSLLNEHFKHLPMKVE